MNSNIPFYVASYLGIFIPALVAMTGLLSVIFVVAVKQIRQIRKLAASVLPATPENQDRSRNRRLSRRTTMTKELKATKSIFIVYFAFVIVWFPNTILHMLIFYDPSFVPTKSIWYTFFDVLPVLNTCINPLIYSFFNKQFREALMYTWRKVLVSAHITDTYLSRDQQTDIVGRHGRESTTIGNPFAIRAAESKLLTVTNTGGR